MSEKISENQLSNILNSTFNKDNIYYTITNNDTLKKNI